MIVGDGRAGKTALANSMIGKSFEDTDSTIGINSMTCSIEGMTVNEKWCKIPSVEKQNENKHYESMVAKLIHSENNRKSKGDVSSGLLYDKNVNTAINLFTVEAGDGGCMNTSTFTMEEKGDKSTIDNVCIIDNKKQSHISSIDNEMNDVSRVTLTSLPKKSDEISPLVEKLVNPQNTQTLILTPPSIDESLVMKCLADKVSLDSKYTIALFDFGGQSVFNVIHPFFLTKYGVYIVTFNMEWLLGSEGKYHCDSI
jgi:GTPase SAR1 family protein